MRMERPAIPTLSTEVIVRPDANGVLLFHVRSDEMYLVSSEAFTILSLCDGSRTIGDIEDELACVASDRSPSDVADAVGAFFSELARRDLVHLWESPS